MAPVTFDKYSNVIDGKLVDSKATRRSINPATLEELPPVPVCTPEDVDRAVEAARRAAPGWAATPFAERVKCLTLLADALEAQTTEFAELLTKEQGKPLKMAVREVSSGINFLRETPKLKYEEEVVMVDNDEKRIFVRYVPSLVSAGIVPWNMPLSIHCFKFSSAVAAGTPMIIKPSPFTPYTNIKLTELSQQFFPPGVVQVLSGDDNLGPWLTSHPLIDHVSFTGSTETGKRVMQSCANTLKRVVLELGGNDAAIVCPSVHLESVVPKIVNLALANSGQICVAIKRVYVHSSIFKQFVAAAVEVVKNMKVGNGFDDVHLGPVQNKLQYDRLKELYESVQADKLTVTNVESSAVFPDKKGYYMNPVIVENPPDSARIVVEEPFGPIFPIVQWEDEADVIRRANDTNAGLGGSVWSSDLDQARRISKQIQAGTVWINDHISFHPDVPFTGHKQSGMGSELGLEGVRGFCNVQAIHENKQAILK